MPTHDTQSRDDSVIEVLIPGEEYKGNQLVEMYRKRTDIVRKRTAKRWTKKLVEREEFEQVGWNKWEYQGGNND